MAAAKAVRLVAKVALAARVVRLAAKAVPGAKAALLVGRVARAAKAVEPAALAAKVVLVAKVAGVAKAARSNERSTNMRKPIRPVPRPFGGDSARGVEAPAGFRRLGRNELVCRGDYVAEEGRGLELWEGPAGFQAGSFARRVYRKDEPKALCSTSTSKPKTKAKH